VNDVCCTSTTLRLAVEPDPSLLVRVTGMLGNIGVVPTKMTFLLLTENLAMLTIEITGLAEHSVDLLHRKLAALPQCMAQASFSTGSRSHLLPAED
jgi:hypothetical protein